MPAFDSVGFDFQYTEEIYSYVDQISVDTSTGSFEEPSLPISSAQIAILPTTNSSVVVSSAARSYGGDYFDRIHIIPAQLDLGNLVSDQVQDLAVFNAYGSSKTLNSIAAVNSDGITLTGQSTPYTFASFEELIYSVSISTQGPPQVDASFDFTWSTSVDNYSLPITGQRIVGIPYFFESPCSEFLEWETDIILTYDGSDEDAIKTRNIPRQFFNVTYPLSQDILNTVENNVYGWRQRTWSINLWTEAQSAGEIVSGATEILLDTTISDYRPNSLIFISSPDGNRTLNVVSVESDRLILQLPITTTLRNCYVMPSRIGRILSEPSKSTNGYNGSMSINYEVTENANIETDTPQQYKGNDVYFEENLLEGALVQDSYAMRMDVLDFSGRVEFSSPWSNPKVKRTKKTIADGLSEVWDYRKWLFRRSGKYREFWYPTFEKNFLLTGSGQIINQFIAKNQLFGQYSSNRSDIAIKMTTGEWILREIIGTTVNIDGTESIILDADLNRDYSEVIMVCYLDLKRLDTDKVELKWNSGQVVESTVSIIDK